MNQSVSFNNEPIIHAISGRDDYSSQEREQYWWSKKELAVIKREMSKTIIWIMGGKHGGEQTFCSRGLEFKTPTNLRIHQQHRQGAIKAILQFQKDANPEIIAKAYTTFSNHSSEEAKVMASII
jgi:hypothetical protein